MALCAGAILEEAGMRFELEPSQDLGLQHILQNGLRILNGASLGQDRDAEVLSELLEIVSDADRGSEALQGQSLTFALDDAPAFERFSLFFRYLRNAPEALTQRLALAKEALQDLGGGAAPDVEHRTALEDLLRELLEALNRERALTPLQTPREFHYH